MSRNRDARDPRRDYPTWGDREKDFEARPVREGGKWIVIVVFGTLAVIALAAIAIFAFNVGTSDIKGQGDAIRQKNDATNRIQQSEAFEQDMAAFDTYPAKIQIASQALDAAKADGDPMQVRLRRTELTGLLQQCVTTATNYNARARKYTAAEFRATDLPERLDPTKCKEDPS